MAHFVLFFIVIDFALGSAQFFLFEIWDQGFASESRLREDPVLSSFSTRVLAGNKLDS